MFQSLGAQQAKISNIYKNTKLKLLRDWNMLEFYGILTF